MSIGNVSKIELVTFDSDTTYTTDIARGFTINPTASYNAVNQAMTRIANLSTNTYSDTVLTTNISLNELQTFQIIPTTATILDSTFFNITSNKIFVKVKKGVYSSTSRVCNFDIWSGFIVSSNTRNFTINRTSSSGTLSLSLIAGTSTPAISLNYTSQWEGTYDSSSAYFNISWKPYSNAKNVTVQIPFEFEIEE